MLQSYLRWFEFLLHRFLFLHFLLLLACACAEQTKRNPQVKAISGRFGNKFKNLLVVVLSGFTLDFYLLQYSHTPGTVVRHLAGFKEPRITSPLFYPIKFASFNAQHPYLSKLIFDDRQACLVSVVVATPFLRLVLRKSSIAYCITINAMTPVSLLANWKKIVKRLTITGSKAKVKIVN